MDVTTSTYQKNEQNQDRNIVHNIVFQQLTNYLNPLLEERRALETLQLLKTYKCYLQENNHENFDSYPTQKTKKDCCKTMDLLL